MSDARYSKRAVRVGLAFTAVAPLIAALLYMLPPLLAVVIWIGQYRPQDLDVTVLAPYAMRSLTVSYLFGVVPAAVSGVALAWRVWQRGTFTSIQAHLTALVGVPVLAILLFFAEPPRLLSLPYLVVLAMLSAWMTRGLLVWRGWMPDQLDDAAGAKINRRD